MKRIRIFLLLSFLFSCNNTPVNYNNLIGFWGLEINKPGNSQSFVAYFSGDGGQVSCEIHSYNDGLKFSSESSSDIKFDGVSLSMVVNQMANVRFTGKLDSISNEIIGRIIYADGSEMDFNLKKISNLLLSEKYPGLEILQTNSNKYEIPTKTNDGWPTGSIATNNFDMDLLSSMISKINNNEFGKVHSILVARNGLLVFEKYFDGYYINDLHSLQSCTKSIGCLLIGLAIDNNYINSVEQNLIDFFPDHQNVSEQQWNMVRLKDVLTMTMGLNWDKELHDRIYEISDDVIETIFDQKFNKPTGTTFKYRNPQADLISAIILYSTGKSVQDFSSEYLFDPLGIKEFKWDNFKNTNYPLMSGSLALRPRDMLKIGQLILNEGKWDGEQIITSQWIQESTSFKIDSDQHFDYGYMWWLGESQNIDNVKVIFAMGIGGEYIVILPELSIVVVTTASNFDRSPEIILKMIDDYIIKGSQ